MKTSCSCPNCGANVTGKPFCDYCGTALYSQEDAFNGMRGKKAHIWYEEDGHIVCCDAYISDVTFDYEYTNLWSAGIPVAQILNRTTLHMDGIVTEFDRSAWDDVRVMDIWKNGKGRGSK